MMEQDLIIQKIKEGLKLSFERLVAQKIKNDQSFAFPDGEKILIIKARDLPKMKSNP